MKVALAVSWSALALWLAAAPLAAHHSVAINFERGEPIEIRGTVKEAHMRNPHSQYVVAVPEKDGTITHNLRTAVIDTDGRVRTILDNNAWTADELVTLLKDALSPPAAPR